MDSPLTRFPHLFSPTPPPHPSLPSPLPFSPLQLGVGGDDHVVVYDNHREGMMSSPRVWWMFRVSDYHLMYMYM